MYLAPEPIRVALSTDPPLRHVREPRSAAVLGYPGISIADLAPSFDRLAALSVEGHAAVEVALVAPGPGALRLAEGGSVDPDYRLDTFPPAIDALIVPCSFIQSQAFASPGALMPLLRALRSAHDVLMLARIPPQARRSQMLLRSISTWPSGAFWEAARPADSPGGTRFIADGHITWAIGPSAARDGIDRIAPALLA
jgi:hypothetical protein